MVVPEAGRHDVEVWPHLHPEELQEKLFPVAVAVPETETIKCCHPHWVVQTQSHHRFHQMSRIPDNPSMTGPDQ